MCLNVVVWWRGVVIRHLHSIRAGRRDGFGTAAPTIGQTGGEDTRAEKRKSGDLAGLVVWDESVADSRCGLGVSTVKLGVLQEQTMGWLSGCYSWSASDVQTDINVKGLKA